MESASGSFCPICKRKNEPGAMICIYCGASLSAVQERPPASLHPKQSQEKTKVLPGLTEEAIQKAFKPPKEGIAVYVRDSATPIDVRREQAFTLGRLLSDEAEQDFVDLKPFGGYENGVSRRHALVRRTAEGYEILDLGSTNGTWMDKKRLTPEKPYPIKSGAQISLGRLQIFVIYLEAAGKP